MPASALIKSTRAFQSRLGTTVGHWQQAIQDWQPPAVSDAATLVETPTLPLQRVAGPRLDLQELVLATDQLVAVPDPEFQQRVRPRRQALVVALLGADAGLLRQLSDIAFEAATYRTLLTPRDRFDVSAVAVLAALALTNYAAALDHFRTRNPRPLEESVLQAIAWPLSWLLDFDGPLRPGDFWFLDLAARTVCLGEPRLPTESPPPREASAAGASSVQELVQFAAPRFFAVSLLYKLLGAGGTPAWVLQEGHYRVWPGLRGFVTDPGTESLRTLVAGELARCLATDGTRLSQAAALRFLAALLALDGADAQVKASLLIANLWWELFGLDDQLLGQLYKHPQLAPTLSAALRAVAQPLERFAEFPEDCSRLAETRQLLRSIDQYRACEALAAPAQRPCVPRRPESTVRTTGPQA
ncbi:MAG: hypothetical protein NTY19_05930 [Planctomycetota bacterium]|nr:hypothetical protein [Planctomycetota bacterium]